MKTLLDNISPLDQAEAEVLRPDWCPLKNACLPKYRDNNGAVGDDEFDVCFGISQGEVLQKGDDDLVYSRHCFRFGEEEPSTLGLDLQSAARFVEGAAIAHRAQIDMIIEGQEGD